MRPKNEFNQFDEVKIVAKNKNGIILEYAYVEANDMYNYLVDCEDEILTLRENELKRV